VFQNLISLFFLFSQINSDNDDVGHRQNFERFSIIGLPQNTWDSNLRIVWTYFHYARLLLSQEN